MASAMDVKRLEAEGLSAVRGGRRVFAGVSFAVEAGQLALLRGPNGVGKSSLLRVLAGLCPPEQGGVRLTTAPDRSFALSAARDGYLERIAYSGHLDALKPGLSVRENLGFWARFLGSASAPVAARRAEAALERFGLAGLAAAPAGLCSAGQKRRLGLARLAVVDRPVWLLDEPTVSLDAASAADFGALVAEHCAAGGVAVAATHIALPVAAAFEIDMSDFRAGAGTGAEAAPGQPGAGGAEDPFLEGGGW